MLSGRTLGMIPRRALALRALVRQQPTIARQANTQGSLSFARKASTEADPDITDPGMNGGYVNPPARKRALRSPYDEWWDPQERRNFGEPVHEDNDVLAVFSTEPYTHASPGKAGFHFLLFVGAFLGVCSAVYYTYPDRPSAPRTFDGGLEAELGGEKAPRAREHGEDTP